MTPLLSMLALTGLVPLLGRPPLHDDPKEKRNSTETTEKAEAEEAKTVWEYLSSRYDTNKDGKIDRSEYTRGDTQFERLDADKNGFIEEADSKQQSRRGRG